MLTFGLPANAAGIVETYEDPGHAYSLSVFATCFDSPASGFYPIQVQIQNTGAPHIFEVRSRNEGSSAHQKIQLARGERGRLFLLHPVPIVENSPYLFGYGGVTLQVKVDGKLVVDRSLQFQTSANSVNVWWVGGLDGASQDIVAEALGSRWPAVAPGQPGQPLAYNLQTARARFQAIQPQELPPNWQGLSTGDIVVASWSALGAMDPERRTAIIEWVQTGGVLLIYDNAGAPNFEQARNTWREWSGSLLRERVTTPGKTPSWSWRAQNVIGEVYALQLSADATPPLARAVAIWFGEVTPAAGTYFSSSVMPALDPARPGTSRSGWSCIREEEIPIVLRRSTWAVLALLIGWVAILFPSQYFFLRKKNLLGWLPGITLLTSIFWMFLMANYGLFTQGVGIRAINRSWTWLDQNSHRAVTTGYSAMVSGWSLGRGLPLPENGWLLPSPPPGASAWSRVNEGRNYVYNWNTPPHLEGTWLAPRSLSCVNTHQVSTVRERLELALQPDGSYQLTNGLGHALHGIYIWDKEKSWMLHTEIAPNQTVTVPPQLLTSAPGSLDVAEASWFSAPSMTRAFHDTRFYIARIDEPRWLHFGFNTHAEEGTQHWVTGTW